MSARSSDGRRWGWHRLADRWAGELVAHAGVRRGDLALDLGAGTGAITDHLLAAGAHVVAVELHPERLAALRARYAEQRVTVVRADLAALRLPRRPFVVVANPPFAVGATVIRTLTGPGSRLQRATLVVPVHTAGRVLSRRPPSGFEMRCDLRVPRAAFTPRPAVDVAVLTIVRRNH